MTETTSRTAWLSWIVVPLAIVSVLALLRDGGGVNLQDYLTLVVKLVEGTLGIVLEAIFRQPLDLLIAWVNNYFTLDLFLQDHWKPAFFLMWVVLSNYVAATWDARTGWWRLAWAFICAMAGSVLAATVNLAHLSVFLWPACFTFSFMAVAAVRSAAARIACVVVAGSAMWAALSLEPTNSTASGTSASIGLLLILIAVIASAALFLVRGTPGIVGGLRNPGRQVGAYILGVVVGAYLIVLFTNWVGPLFITSRPVTVPDGSFTVRKDCEESWCPEMVSIPVGSFDMGADDDETAYAIKLDAPADRVKNEKPQHRVTVGKFWLARTEITRGQFRAFVEDSGYRPGHFCWVYERNRQLPFSARNDWRNPGFAQTSDAEPVVCVTWHDTQAYVRWLSAKTGQTYRLPSEAEWEFAARAGTRTSRYWGQENKDACTHANVLDETLAKHLEIVQPSGIFYCSDNYALTAPVGQFGHNAFGLYDTLGNVWELTDDHYSDSYAGALTDGSVWRAGNLNARAVRGGGRNDDPWTVRSASRMGIDAAVRYSTIGFRVARTD
jgi:sulfatase modifying factor 1